MAVNSLFVFDPVDEEVDGTVEGGEKMTQTGDKLHPVWPKVCLISPVIKLRFKQKTQSHLPVLENGEELPQIWNPFHSMTEDEY